MEQKQDELTEYNSEQTGFYLTKSGFEHAQRVAQMFSKSELVPKKYIGNVSNCMIAMEIADRMKISILMVMQNLDVIMGRPSWSSQFLIATLNSSGKFSPLRYDEDESEGGRTRAWAIDKATGDKLYGEWVSMNMAKAEGWIEKSGSKWKTMPGLMRRYRAASFFVKQFAPEISMGFQTVEEIRDFEVIETTQQKQEFLNNVDKELERSKDFIASAKTVQELEQNETKIASKYPELFDIIEKRKEEIRSQS